MVTDTLSHSTTVVYPGDVPAVEAHVKAINAEGGINGRQVQVDSCDNNGYDPNAEVQCAQQAVSDHVVALVGSQIHSPAAWQILTKAGIPAVFSSGDSVTEFQSPIAYPIAGEAGYNGGMVAALAQAEATKIRVIQCNYSACSDGTKLLNDYVNAAHSPLTMLPPVNATIGTLDMSSVAAQAVAGGADGIVVDTIETDAVKIVRALRQQGYTGHIATLTAVMSQDDIKALGSLANGMLLVDLFRPVADSADPGIQEYQKEMAAVGASQYANDRYMLEWAAAVLFQKIAEQVPNLTASSLLSALGKQSTPVNLDGVAPPYRTVGVANPLPQLNHLYVQSVFIGVVQPDGSLKLTSPGPQEIPSLLGQKA
jgi:ABC-type branched-subunit amino acid transport system substrate-binding protein